MPRVKIGCCGFPRGMKDYFSQFRLVEVQQTFYKMPKLETALRWRQQAPSDFEFTLKDWQLITHPPTSPTYRRAGIKIPPGGEERYGFFNPSDEVWDSSSPGSHGENGASERLKTYAPSWSSFTVLTPQRAYHCMESLNTFAYMVRLVTDIAIRRRNLSILRIGWGTRRAMSCLITSICITMPWFLPA